MFKTQSHITRNGPACPFLHGSRNETSLHEILRSHFPRALLRVRANIIAHSVERAGMSKPTRGCRDETAAVRRGTAFRVRYDVAGDRDSGSLGMHTHRLAGWSARTGRASTPTKKYRASLPLLLYTAQRHARARARLLVVRSRIRLRVSARARARTPPCVKIRGALYTKITHGLLRRDIPTSFLNSLISDA